MAIWKFLGGLSPSPPPPRLVRIYMVLMDVVHVCKAIKCPDLLQGMDILRFAAYHK